MKYAMHHDRLAELLCRCDHEHPAPRAVGIMDNQNGLSDVRSSSWLITAFFFHDRGSEMQKTLPGMLKELLFSLCTQQPAILKFLVPLWAGLTVKQRTHKPVWDTETLQEGLMAIVRQRNVRLRILFFLDALDEKAGDKEHLAALVEQIVEQADGDFVVVKICLASRPWPVFEGSFGHYPGFAIHDYTISDIRKYTTSRLASASRGLSSLNERSLASVTDLVTSRASGVFIWVRLVVDVLVKGIRNGTAPAALERQAQDIPQELEELYGDTLRRVEPEYQCECFIALQIAVCSLIPLSIRTFLEVTSKNYNYFSAKGHQRSQSGYETLSDDMIQGTSGPYHKRWLESRSGGLLEVVQQSPSDKWTPEEQGFVVQFIHQTVKDFIKSSHHTLKLSSIPPEVMQEDGHVFLLRACEESENEWICDVKKDMFSYAKRIEDIKSGHHDSSLPRSARKNLQAWKLLDDVTMYGASGYYDIDWVFTHCFANVSSGSGRRGGTAGIGGIEEAPDSHASRVIGRRRGIGGTEGAPNSDAPRGMGRQGYALPLMSIAANLLESVSVWLSEKPPDFVGPSTGLLSYAVSGRLMQTGSCNINPSQMVKIILEAVGSAELVGSLNEHNYPDDSGFIHHNMTLVGLLLFINPETINRNESMQLGIARLLLDSGADVNFPLVLSPIHNQFSIVHIPPLIWCVWKRSAAFVRLLLQYGADPEASTVGRLPLRAYALMREDPEIIQTLEDHGYAVKEDVAEAEGWFKTIPGKLASLGLLGAAPAGGTAVRELLASCNALEWKRKTRNTSDIIDSSAAQDKLQ